MARIRRQRDQARKAKTATIEAVAQSVKHKRAVERMIAAESSRLLPTDTAIDRDSKITDDDITTAVELWDDAQKDGSTGLDGMLDARVSSEDG